MDFLSYVKDLINGNPGKTIGSCLGLIVGILIFTLGIVKTILVVVLVFIGFIIGKSRDEDISVIDAFIRFFTNRNAE